MIESERDVIDGDENMNVIYKIVSGSRMYGTDDKDSDYDYRGVWLPTLEQTLSMNGLNDYRHDIGDYDVLYYPIQKFIKLAVSGNPNVIDWLFAPKWNAQGNSFSFTEILNNKELFIGRHIIPKIFGFAKGEYESVAKKTNRKTGAKRRVQMEKFGYSPKNAMNAIRVLQQGAELIMTGKITFPRQNAKELKDIKTGKIKEKDLDGLYQESLSAMRVAEKTCTLRAEPNIYRIEEIMFDILTSKFKNKAVNDYKGI